MNKSYWRKESDFLDQELEDGNLTPEEFKQEMRELTDDYWEHNNPNCHCMSREGF